MITRLVLLLCWALLVWHRRLQRQARMQLDGPSPSTSAAGTPAAAALTWPRPHGLDIDPLLLAKVCSAWLVSGHPLACHDMARQVEVQRAQAVRVQAGTAG